MLLRAAQAKAVLEQRDYVLPDDVQSIAADVISHRVSARSLSSANDVTNIVKELITQVEVPV